MLPVINYADFTVQDIRTCLENAGYITTNKEFEVAQEDGAFKYVKGNMFLVGFYDDMIGDNYIVGELFVDYCTKKHLWTAEYSGCPKMEGTLDEVIAFIKSYQ